MEFQHAVQIGTLSVATGALVVSSLNYFQTRRAFAETRVAERRKTVLTKLNEFYGPLATYMSTIDALGRLFLAGKPANFRTLTYLLDPDQEYDTPGGRVKVVLSASDRELLRDIVDVEKKAEDLIVAKGGLVEDPVLAADYRPDPGVTDIPAQAVKGLGLLAVLVAHFRVQRLAYEGKIAAEPWRYEAFVYPRELDKKLRAKIDELQAQLRALGGEPTPPA